MLWIKLALAAAALLPAAALAVECPAGSSPSALEPYNWEFTEAGRVMVAVRNTFDKQVRMVDAVIYFEDGLGRTLGDAPLPVNPDLAIFPKKANSFQVVAPPGYERLSVADLDDYLVTMCTSAILFVDGSKAEF